MDNTNIRLKILVIVGTVRQNRAGRQVADWYLREAKKVTPSGMDLELFEIENIYWDQSFTLLQRSLPFLVCG